MVLFGFISPTITHTHAHTHTTSQYENQVNILGNWTNRGPTMSRPKFSDSEGRIELMKEDFQPPAGWAWEADWYINPDLSMLFDKDAGHHNFLEDTYECQSRNIPGGQWGEASRSVLITCLHVIYSLMHALQVFTHLLLLTHKTFVRLKY